MGLKKLNKTQRAAVEANDGPILIFAGAGSGKTRVLTHKMFHLISEELYKPENILSVTFTNKAAKEMKERVMGLLKTDDLPITIGTFHSVCARLLRIEGKHLGLSPQFAIYDVQDQLDLLKVVLKELNIPKDTLAPNHARNQISYLKNKMITPSTQARKARTILEKTIVDVYSSYQKALRENEALDFDDLLLYPLELFDKHPKILKKYQNKWKYILVDEYQDTNVLQAGILKGFFPTGEGLTVVGDDAQSIYSFRSATVDNILNFPDAFSLPGKVITLQQNYRSHPNILNLSNTLLSESDEGYKVSLFSERKSGPMPKWITVENDIFQAEYIVERVLAAREEGVDLKQQAVLFRSSYHSDRLELELTRRNIPFVKHGGLKFLEASHVKDMLCILRWADNPKHKISAFRVLKLLPGIGPKIAEKAFNALEQQDFAIGNLRHFAISESAKPTFLSLVDLLDNVHHNNIPWTEQTSAIAAFYKDLLEANYDDHFTRYGDVEQLTMISGQYSSRERFLTELTLDPPQSTGDLAGKPLLDDDFLILSTVHSAKGQEWKHVFVLNVADGNFPNEYAAGDKRALEEERRLLYVAITRAKDELSLIQPLKYWVPEQQKFGDKHVYGAKSRFFTDAVCACMEPIAYPKRTASASEKKIAKGAIADIKKNILGMWNNTSPHR